MNERQTQWIGYTLFSSLLLALDLWVICALLLSRAEPRVAAIQEDAVLAEYRRHVSYQMHLLTASGCFRSTDACLDYAQEMVTRTRDGMTRDGYRRYLVEGLDTLWNRGCLKAAGDCQTFTFDSPNDSPDETAGGEGWPW
jgi:hypothetical protein